MIFLSVVVLPLLLLFAVLALAGLIGFPLRPNSWAFRALWGLGLLSLAALFAWPGKGGVWHPPAWKHGVDLVFLAIPYGTSLYFWHRERRKRRRLSDVATGSIVLVVAVASALAVKWYNTSCVYFDYHHDHGQAWCPASWQAGLGRR